MPGKRATKREEEEHVARTTKTARAAPKGGVKR